MENNLNPQKPEKQKKNLTTQEKILFSKLAINLSRAFVQTHTFGIDHMYAKDAIEQSFAALRELLQAKDEITLCVIEGKLRYDMVPLEENNLLVDKLIKMLSTVQLVSFRFTKETSEEDYKKFLNIFHNQLENIVQAGGVETLAKQADIKTIEINPLKYELVGKDQQVIDEDEDIFEVDSGAEDIMEDVQKPQEEIKEELEEHLLQLIDDIFQEGTESSILMDKIKEDATKMANSLVEAIKIIDRVGIEKSEPLVSSILQKLIFIKNELSTSLEDDQAHPAKKEINKFSSVLSRNLKSLELSEEIQPFLSEVKKLNTALEDRIKAETVIIGINKDTIDQKKEAKIARSVTKRKKKSKEYEPLIKDILSKRGFSEMDYVRILKEGAQQIKKKKHKKAIKMQEKVSPLLEKISGNQLDQEAAKTQLNELFEGLVKEETKKLKNEKQQITTRLQHIEDMLNSLNYGIAIIAEGNKVIYINDNAKNILKVKSNDMLTDSLISGLKQWPHQDNLPSLSEDIKKILDRVKAVKKDDNGVIKNIVLEPLP